MKSSTKNERMDWRLQACILAFAALSGSAVPGIASAASIVVNSLDDADPFTTADAKCTLREAIANANSNANNTADTSGDCAAGSGADTITFSVSGTIKTASSYTTSDVTKDDANELVIDGGNQVTLSGENDHRVFLVVDTPLTLQGITIINGRTSISESGGAIRNLDKLTIKNSTLSGNSAGDTGGAIRSFGELEIIGSTLSGNESRNSSGGAIYVLDGTAIIKNSTISANSASAGGGGGIWGGGSSVATVEIVNSTVVHNAATDGGGLAGGGTISVTNSIVANSSDGGDCDTSATVLSYGNNVDTDGTCTDFGQVTSTALNLGPLFFNGGPTKTHALSSGSVAIDAGVQSGCDAAGITTDQRGASRPADGNADGTAACDIGAYEYVPPPPPQPADLGIAKSAAKTAKSGKQLTYTINVRNNGPSPAPDVVVNDVLPPGTSFASLSAPGAAVCTTPAVGFTGTVSCSYNSLDSGSSISPIYLYVKVTAKGNTQLNNTATVSITSTTTVDPNAANNSATATSKVAR